MKRFIRRRPRPGTIIAIVALIVALAGTAVAAGPFLPKRKFSNFKRNTAVKGPITYVNQTQNVQSPGQNITAPCPTGFEAVGGGAKTNATGPSGFQIINTYPSADGWTVRVQAGPAPESVTVSAVCERGRTNGTPPAISP